MSVTTEWSKLTNNDSKLAVFINGRPYYWTCHAGEQEQGANQVARYVIVDDFLVNLIRKTTKVEIPKDDSDKKLYEEKVYEGKVELQKQFKSDYDVFLQIEDLTNDIAEKMVNKQFSKNGPEPIKG